MKDGHLNQCKDCRPSVPRVNQREHNKTYFATENGRNKTRKSKRKWQAKNPKKCYAHDDVWRAVKNGILKKAPCEVCGSENVHAHHCNYDKVLEVMWLCRTHHREWHKLNGPGLNGE